MNKVLVRLKGGLGNQLFQYAAAKEQAFSRGIEVVHLDLSYLETKRNPKKFTNRIYELGSFNFNTIFATDEDISSFLVTISRKNYIRIMQDILPISRYTVRDNYSVFRKYLDKSNSCYLNGYFQSERYFTNIASSLKSDLYSKLKAVREQIKEKLLPDIYLQLASSVCLHIRRGDYITLPSASKTHGNCDVDYFKDAIDFLKNKIHLSNIYVFSDDIEWCESNLPYQQLFNFKFMSKDLGLSAFEEFAVMSGFEHFIISNSSFSWWTAWIGETEDSVIITPKQWSLTSVKSEQIVPNRWLKI